MPAILKIGYLEFLVKSETAAIAALKALSDAIPVDCAFDGRQMVYFPETKDPAREIELKIVKASQLRRTNPKDDKPQPLQLGYGGKVHYMPGEGK